MEKKLDLSYFYGPESDQFNFIRIPKMLLFDPMYSEVTLEEAAVYSMLLDRMSLSMKNGWYDEAGRAYVYCSIETVMEFARCKKNKAGDILKKLDGIGLIDKVLIPGRGLKIYVKNFIPKNGQEFEKQTLEQTKEPLSELIEGNKADVDNLEAVDFLNYAGDFLNRADDFSDGVALKTNEGNPKKELGVVYFSNTNNNKINNTNLSNTKSIHITSDQNESQGYDDDEMGYANIIRENISLDTLMERYPCDRDFLQGIYDLILETVLTTSDYIVVASNQYSSNFVRGKLLKLDSMHIEYVLSCWRENAERPRNVKKYLLAALFNAPSTMDAYYQAEYNHDQAYGVN